VSGKTKFDPYLCTCSKSKYDKIIENSALLSFFPDLRLQSVQAQPPKTPATPGTTFGAVITAENATTVAELPTLLGDKEMADVKIEGKVLDVCSKKGCWMSLEMPDKSTVLVKFKDYGFFVPLEMIGKTVVLEGQAKKD
jgi:hypothetical protein